MLSTRKLLLAFFPLVVFVSFLILTKTPVKAEHFFSSNSTWYTKIPTNPTLYPNSANYIARLVQSQSSLYYNYRWWSVPIYYATGSTPLVSVYYNSDGISGTTMVPIPSNALPAGYSYQLNGEYVDAHLAVISADRKWAWDFWDAHKDPTTGAWRASTYRKWNLESTGVMQPYTNPDLNVTPEGRANARVCPTTLLHGLVTYKEAVVDKYIDHALAFIYGGTEPLTNQTMLGRLPPIYPCEHPVNSGWYDNQWSPPLGMRFQMDPSINIETLGLTQTEKVIAKALQEYGMIYVESTGPGLNGVYIEDLEHDTTRSWSGHFVDTIIKTSMFRAVQPIYPAASSSSSSATSSTTTTVSSSSTTVSTPMSTNYDAIRVHNPVSLDGQLAEAAWLRAIPINFSNQGRSNNSSSFKVIWDRVAVYVGADITDSQIDTTGADIWLDDSIEIFFDTALNKSTSLDSDDFQVIINSLGEVSTSGVQVAVGNRSGGYRLEVKIPWSVMNVTPEFMNGFGILLANNDRDLGVVTSYDNMGIIDVAPNTFKRPNLWGSIATNVSTTWKSGDYTNDEQVGLPDFAVFAGRYKMDSMECEYDLIGDNCYLDIADFQVFASNYGS